MTYLLDANIFIQAKNSHYGFDLCPGFWDWIDQAHAQGRLHSVEKIRGELLAGGDELAEWARNRESLFLPPDEQVVECLRALTVWATQAGYEAAAVSTFLAGADSYLVAHANAHRLTVVTHEIAADTRRKLKIPNACDGVGASHCTPFEMLRAEGVRFVLDD